MVEQNIQSLWDYWKTVKPRFPRDPLDTLAYRDENEERVMLQQWILFLLERKVQEEMGLMSIQNWRDAHQSSVGAAHGLGAVMAFRFSAEAIDVLVSTEVHGIHWIPLSNGGFLLPQYQ
jgi:hypothetical protein